MDTRKLDQGRIKTPVVLDKPKEEVQEQPKLLTPIEEMKAHIDKVQSLALKLENSPKLGFFMVYLMHALEALIQLEIEHLEKKNNES
jgi:hypothetical protein